MKRRLPLVVVVVLLVAIISYWLYPRFFTPVWSWDTTFRAPYSSLLVSDNGLIYRELEWPYSEEYQPGRQIGRTSVGFRICKVKGHASQDLVLLTGLMLPPIVFRSE